MAGLQFSVGSAAQPQGLTERGTCVFSGDTREKASLQIFLAIEEVTWGVRVLGTAAMWLGGVF